MIKDPTRNRSSARHALNQKIDDLKRQLTLMEHLQAAVDYMEGKNILRGDVDDALAELITGIGQANGGD